MSITPTDARRSGGEIDAVAVAVACSRGYRVVAAAAEIDCTTISQKSYSAKIEIDVALGR